MTIREQVRRDAEAFALLSQAQQDNLTRDLRNATKYHGFTYGDGLPPAEALLAAIEKARTV
jgi:hypothetical protein